MQELNPISDLDPEAYIALIALTFLGLAIAVIADGSGTARDVLREAFWTVWASPFVLLSAYMAWNQINPYQGKHRLT